MPEPTSTKPSADYHLFVEGGSLNVGVWNHTTAAQKEQAGSQQDIGQFVRLDVDLVKWVATPPISHKVDAHLAVDRYKYTGMVNDHVFASDDPIKSNIWHFIYSAEKDAYYISVDKDGENVWTVGAKEEPVMIQKFTGEPNQTFTFFPLT